MKTASTLRLFASRLACDAALDEACRAAPAGAVWADEATTLSEWLYELDRRLPRGEQKPRRVLQDAARLAVLADAWRKVRSAERPPPAALNGVGRLIAGWKGAGLEPAHLRQAGVYFQTSQTALSERLVLIAQVWQTYEALLGDDWTDREGWGAEVLRRLQRAVEADPAGLFADEYQLVGVLRLAPLQRAVCEALLQARPKLRIQPAVPLPAEPVAVEPSSTPAPFETLAQTLGELRPQVENLDAPTPPNIHRIEAPTPYAEVYEMGRRVRRWILDDGLRPDQIAVVFRDLGPYSQFIADVFQRLNIPYYERRGEPLAFQPVVRAALTGLDAVRGGLGREVLFRFLTSGPVNLPVWLNLPAGDVPSTGKLHALALAARVDQFFGAEQASPVEGWTKRLTAHVETLRRRGRVDEATEAARGQDVLLQVVTQLAELQAPRKRVEFVDAWRGLWRAAGFRADAARDRDPLSLRRRSEALQGLEDALAETAVGPGGKRVDLEDFAMLLEEAVSARSVRNQGRHRAGGVRVLSLFDLRGLQFRRVILGGMNDKLFPAPAAPDPILGEAPAASLRSALVNLCPAAAPLAHVEPRLKSEVRDEERALLDMARRAAREEWILTRHRNDFDGQPAGASVFWDEPAWRDVEPKRVSAVRPAPALRDCLSGEEAELRTAWVLGGGRDEHVIEADATPTQSERALAAAAFDAGRLKALAGRAAVERARETYFEDLALQDTDDSEAFAQHAGPYDGELSSHAPSAPAQIEKALLTPVEVPADIQAPPGATLSPSALETLAGCAFRFMGERLFRLRDDDEPEDDLSPRDKGSLWHAILADFYGGMLDEARRAGRHVAVLDPANRPASLKRLLDSAQRILDAAPEKMFTGRPGFWSLRRDEIERQLSAWLDLELAAASQPDAPCPAFVEFAFGNGDRTNAPAVRVPTESETGPHVLLLEGRIDRLDLVLKDPRATTPTVTGLRLIDYKISASVGLKKKVGMEEIHALRNAQLPVYLAAAMGFLRKMEEEAGWKVDWSVIFDRSTAGYFTLADLTGRARKEKTPVLEVDNWEPGLKKFLNDAGDEDNLYDIIRRKMAGVLRGNFPVAPVECQGVWCAARFACRYRNMPVEGGDSAGRGDV